MSPEQIAAAQAAQEEACEDLKDWWADWGTHLRSVFNVRDQIVLGLTRRDGRSAVETADEAEDTTGDEEKTGDDDEESPGDPGEEASSAPPTVAKPKKKGK